MNILSIPRTIKDKPEPVSPEAPREKEDVDRLWNLRGTNFAHSLEVIL